MLRLSMLLMVTCCAGGGFKEPAAQKLKAIHDFYSDQRLSPGSAAPAAESGSDTHRTQSHNILGTLASRRTPSPPPQRHIPPVSPPSSPTRSRSIESKHAALSKDAEIVGQTAEETFDFVKRINAGGNHRAAPPQPDPRYTDR